MTRDEFRLAFSEDVAEADREFCEMVNGDMGLYPDISNDGLTRLTDIAAATAEPLFERIAELERPVDLKLYCPACGHQHIDEPQPEKDWSNPPHTSHECQACGHTWRIADVHTNGVAEIKTKGQRDGSSAPTNAINNNLLGACKAALNWYYSEAGDILGRGDDETTRVARQIEAAIADALKCDPAASRRDCEDCHATMNYIGKGIYECWKCAEAEAREKWLKAEKAGAELLAACEDALERLEYVVSTEPNFIGYGPRHETVENLKKVITKERNRAKPQPSRQEQSESGGRFIKAVLLAAAEKCEQLLLSHGDPFRGDDWQAMQDVRAALADARSDAPTARGADAIALVGELREALWAILYADQDNHIPDELHGQARAVIDKADAFQRQPNQQEQSNATSIQSGARS